MPTLHLTTDGRVAVCHAEERSCPRDQHFASTREAVEALNSLAAPGTSEPADSALDEEASDFLYETGYRVREILDEREVTLEEVAEAERIDRPICVKIPGGSEVYISTRLARRELSS